jgi:hypothetical protein
MLICVCLRILASSRIPQYDLGRQTPHFLGGSVTIVYIRSGTIPELFVLLSHLRLSK